MYLTSAWASLPLFLAHTSTRFEHLWVFSKLFFLHLWSRLRIVYIKLDLMIYIFVFVFVFKFINHRLGKKTNSSKFKYCSSLSYKISLSIALSPCTKHKTQGTAHSAHTETDFHLPHMEYYFKIDFKTNCFSFIKTRKRFNAQCAHVECVWCFMLSKKITLCTSYAIILLKIPFSRNGTFIICIELKTFITTNVHPVKRRRKIIIKWSRICYAWMREM